MKDGQNATQSSSLFHILLRVAAFLATLASALMMFLNKETKDFGGFELGASYKSSPAFKFFLGSKSVASVYLFISMFLHKLVDKSLALRLLDLLTMVFVIAAASAVAAISWVGKYGNDEIGWPKVCPYYPNYCTKSTYTMIISFVACLLLLIICGRAARPHRSQSSV